MCCLPDEIAVEPESHAVEEMKARGINERGPAVCIFGSEKNRGRQNALKFGDEALAVRPGLQEELATMACVHQLGLRRSRLREPAKHKWPGVEGPRRLTILSLFANKVDRIKLFESAPQYADYGATRCRHSDSDEKPVVFD